MLAKHGLMLASACLLPPQLQADWGCESASIAVLSLAYVNISFALSWHIRVTFRRAFFATWRDEAAGGSSAASHEGHARAAAGAGDALAESVPGSSRCSSRAVILEDVECVATAD